MGENSLSSPTRKPCGGFLKWGYPQIIPFSWDFSYKASSSWGSPMWNPPCVCPTITEHIYFEHTKCLQEKSWNPHHFTQLNSPFLSHCDGGKFRTPASFMGFWPYGPMVSASDFPRGWFLCPNSFHINDWGDLIYFISNRSGCFGDVKQIPKTAHLPTPDQSSDVPMRKPLDPSFLCSSAKTRAPRPESSASFATFKASR